MKLRIFLTLLLVLFATSVFADGPASLTVSATTAGVKVLVQPLANASTPRHFDLTAVCVDDGVTITTWKYSPVTAAAPSGTWTWLGGLFHIVGADSSHAPASMILPLSGEIFVIRLTTDTVTADVDLHFYTD